MKQGDISGQYICHMPYKSHRYEIESKPTDDDGCKYELFSCQERIELSRKLGVTEQQVSFEQIDVKNNKQTLI